jgi:hypothetical protein
MRLEGPGSFLQRYRHEGSCLEMGFHWAVTITRGCSPVRLSYLTFFTLVWPPDATRSLVAEGSADAWF